LRKGRVSRYSFSFFTHTNQKQRKGLKQWTIIKIERKTGPKPTRSFEKCNPEIMRMSGYGLGIKSGFMSVGMKNQTSLILNNVYQEMVF